MVSTSSGATTPITCTFASVTDRFCSATGLTNGAVYITSVRAINRMGEGAVGSVSYAVPSNDATLSDLLVSGSGSAIAIVPAFATNTYDYAVEVPFTVSAVTLTATTSVDGSTFTINGATESSGVESASIPLTEGINTFTIEVIASDPRFTQTYTVVIRRAVAPASESGSWSRNPNVPVAVPSGILAGATTGAVLESGVVRTDVTITPLKNDSGLRVVGSDFSLSVETLSNSGQPSPLVTNGIMRALQGGSIAISGSGYEASSMVAGFLIPRLTSRMAARLDVRADSSAIYLGSTVVSATGSFSGSFAIPSSISIGDYVLQLNGLSEQAQLRSVNMRLDVAAQTQPVSRAGKVRAAAFYLKKSAVLSVEGESKLRKMISSIPVGASDATINIVGVSVSMDSRSENIKLARERAEVIADYLEAKGVKGSYNLSITTSYEVRSSSGSIDKNSDSDKPASTEDGKPLTTTTIDFVVLP